jgi:hypothetical protein
MNQVPRTILRMQWFLARLLCVLVLSAALDRVPDPPVLKPERNTSLAVCANVSQALAGFSQQQSHYPAVPWSCIIVPPVSSSASSKTLPHYSLWATTMDLWRASGISPPYQNA